MENNKNKLMMISIIILLLVLLGVIVAIAFYVIKNINNANNLGEEDAADSPKVVELQREQITSVPFSDSLSTNLLSIGDGINHAIKITIGVGINNVDKKAADAFITTLTDNEIVVRDTVIDILHNKTNEELLKPDGMALLKAEILERLQEEFNTNLIVEVTIGEWYVY